MNKNQTIKCQVHDCRFHEDNMCMLPVIKVAKCDNNATKEATICDSYQNGE